MSIITSAFHYHEHTLFLGTVFKGCTFFRIAALFVLHKVNPASTCINSVRKIKCKKITYICERLNWFVYFQPEHGFNYKTQELGSFPREFVNTMGRQC